MYSVNYEEIVLRSEYQGDFYTDDSYNLIKRRLISEKEANEKGINFPDKKYQTSMIGLNSYPCTEGYYNSHIFTSLSHPTMCNIVSSNEFEIMLLRSVKNSDEKGINFNKNEDNTLSRLEIKFS